jgi:hypothetical protein
MQKKMMRTRFVLAGAVLIVLVFFTYSKRLQVAALLWHWKNGDSVRVGQYEVPVPHDWLVRVDPGITYLTDTHPSRDANDSVIMIFSTSPPTGNFDFWISYTKQWLKEQGVTPMEERSLRFEDEAVACLGGHELTRVRGAADIISLECRSSGNLRLMFVGQKRDLQLLYSLVPRIHRISQKTGDIHYKQYSYNAPALWEH